MNGLTRTARALATLGTATVACLSGCDAIGDWTKTDKYRFLSPEKVIRPPDGSPINPILGSIGPTDRVQEVVPNATRPTDGDWEYTDEEYVIGPTDVVDISILDLFSEGLETVLRRQVTENGMIDLPLLRERVKAEGRTKEQLKADVMRAYSPNILRDPTVSVTIAARRQNTFSILGAINRPGTYNILRKDMRLLEALALSGGITQTNIQYLYVIRPRPAKRIVKAPAEAEAGGVGAIPDLPPEAPPEPATRPAPATAPATKPAVLDPNAALRELGQALPGAATQPATKPAPKPGLLSDVPRFAEAGPAAGAAAPETQPGIDGDLKRAVKAPKWIYSAGKWVRTGGQEPLATQPVAATQQAGEAGRDPADPFGWKKVDKSDMARIIAINLDQLRDGDPRQNIVLRDNDIVQIPPLEVGEFYIMGEVLRPGVYSLTGRQITVKMALAAAGNMSALAWPENSILIRRVGDRQEQVIPLNLEEIFLGNDPDLFLKSNDVIAVGTDVRASFMAVVRNAFRMSYGFGFIYDRNFSDPRLITPTSRRFTRW
ncbi:MAG TPA: polysaccharide biosynthesis/export family protein [Phycisphaerae bacterium]|nr:polysaccharide biosynthesis/export family protein [Phycisphaerae bacterium]